MSKYIYSVSEYMDAGPQMDEFDCNTPNGEEDAILDFFEEEVAEMREDGMSDEDILDNLREANGDGQPYIQIYSVDFGGVIFG